MQLDEQTGVLILAVGLGLVAIGYLWLVVRAFGTRLWWGLVAFLLAPVGGIVYALVHARRAIWPGIVMLVGALTAASPVALNKLFPPIIAPIQNVTTGETDLTVTGQKDFDYSTLAAKTDLTVLQMANPDVTDATLDSLKGMSKLKRLDLSDTAITDAGLAVLGTLPALEDVKLARTKITDAGMKKLLADAKSLKEIDARGTTVATGTLRDWKNADKDARKYLK